MSYSILSVKPSWMPLLVALMAIGMSVQILGEEQPLKPIGAAAAEPLHPISTLASEDWDEFGEILPPPRAVPQEARPKEIDIKLN